MVEVEVEAEVEFVFVFGGETGIKVPAEKVDGGGYPGLNYCLEDWGRGS